MADFCVLTYNLIPLVNVYLKIAKQLSSQQEYEKAVRILKKALRITWIQNLPSVEIKVYEMLAIQYFYIQDITKSKQFQDRATRGKIEAATSSCRKVAIAHGIRSDDDAPNKQKLVLAGAYQKRTNTTKISDAVVNDYQAIDEIIYSIPQETKMSIKQMVEDVTN